MYAYMHIHIPIHTYVYRLRNATGHYDVEVGRIRQSIVFGDHGIEFFVSGDQLLRGAALNLGRRSAVYLDDITSLACGLLLSLSLSLSLYVYTDVNIHMYTYRNKYTYIYIYKHIYIHTHYVIAGSLNLSRLGMQSSSPRMPSRHAEGLLLKQRTVGPEGRYSLLGRGPVAVIYGATKQVHSSYLWSYQYMEL